MMPAFGRTCCSLRGPAACTAEPGAGRAVEAAAAQCQLQRHRGGQRRGGRRRRGERGQGAQGALPAHHQAAADQPQLRAAAAELRLQRGHVLRRQHPAEPDHPRPVPA